MADHLCVREHVHICTRARQRALPTARKGKLVRSRLHQLVAPTCRSLPSLFLEANQARHSSRRRLPRATSGYLGLGIWMTIFGWWQLGSPVTHDLLHCTLERGQGRGLWLLHLGCEEELRRIHIAQRFLSLGPQLAKAGFGEDLHAHTRHHTQHGHNHPTGLGIV